MQGVTEICTECGFDPAAMDEHQLGPELARHADGYEAIIAEASATNCAALSSRPSPEVWSILEYVGHVVFLYDKVDEMCASVANDAEPSVQGVDPDEHALSSRFNDVAASEMSANIREAGERAPAALNQLDRRALDRTLAFNGHPVPLRIMTMAMVHESHHHLRDVNELLTG